MFTPLTPQSVLLWLLTWWWCLVLCFVLQLAGSWAQWWGAFTRPSSTQVRRWVGSKLQPSPPQNLSPHPRPRCVLSCWSSAGALGARPTTAPLLCQPKSPLPCLLHATEPRVALYVLRSDISCCCATFFNTTFCQLGFFDLFLFLAFTLAL